MSGKSTELSIKGESIQSLYGSFLTKTFLVNRRYQRKLVWTLEEKRSFLDSIINGYPVPLILLVEVSSGERGKKLEIIDGMQRMNAIMSFIEQEFDIDGCYFDLDTMADTKLLKDNGKLVQKNNVLDRNICANIVRYTIPLSIFQELGSNSHVDEVFRRLNSGGKHLSKQELRQAGAVSKFASIVRKLSSNIRGDSSVSDVLDLNSMQQISITNKNLNYGINVDDIFWVKNNIITKEDLRQSKDEEIIADIVAWVSMGKLRSSSDILNQLYGYGNNIGDTSLNNQVEIQIQKINEDILLQNVQSVFDKLIALIGETEDTFNSLLFGKRQAKIARYFQIVFLSFYHLIIEENLDLFDKEKLLTHLDKAGDNVISLAAGGGNWSAKEKHTQINAFSGVIKDCFCHSKQKDPTRDQWITRFENLLMQSTEQTLYDFKVGLHGLFENSKELNAKSFSKIIKTLTAMANTFPESSGYCIIGVADNERTAKRFKELYKDDFITYSHFYITGVNSEANKFYGDVDKYFTRLTQLIKTEPISERDKDNISRNISTINYFNKTLIILKIESDKIPSIYDGKYYVRHGSNINEVEPKDFAELFSRFQ
ncbi:DUF262 domain-containing protein [Candidatus Electrothrix gigas]